MNVTTIPGPPTEIEHAYAVGDTIEKTRATVGAVVFGNPIGLYAELPCYHYANDWGGWDFVETIDAKYPKPAPTPATTTTIVIEQYGDEPFYGSTNRAIQRAVVEALQFRCVADERWVVTTTHTGADHVRQADPVTVDKPELDSLRNPSEADTV